MKRILSILFVCAAAFTAAAQDGFVTLSYPLAVSVEGENVPTAMHMKFDIKRYDAPFDAFATRELDAREQKFVQWMKAIRTRDYTKAAGMFAEPRTVQAAVDKSAEHSRVVAAKRTPKNVVDMYNGAFGGFRDVTVVAQILAGSKSLFVWEAKGGQVDVRRAFAVTDDLKVSEVTMSTPVEVLIVNNVMGPGARDANADRGVAGFEAPYEYAFPLDGPWTPGPHPVFIQFSGTPVDIPIFGDEVPADPIAALYHNAFNELKQRNVEKFLGYFTPKSKAKWERWYQSLSTEGFNQFHAMATAPRAIKFILDAGPVKIVFHGDAGNWTAGSLRYDYVVKSATGEWKFANVAFSGFFDDVIGSPSLFDQNVLRGAEAKTR